MSCFDPVKVFLFVILLFSHTLLSPILSCPVFPRLDVLGLVEVQSEDDQGTDSEHDPLTWQQLVSREVLAGLRPHEIKRQEVINGEDRSARLSARTHRFVLPY